MFKVKPVPTSMLVPLTPLCVVTEPPAAVPVTPQESIAPSIASTTVIVQSLSGVRPPRLVPKILILCPVL